MLKALELYGFKSFPDRTRFEFPAGITVIVGPNGSGKSNIVDGIKWVLGEQSAKSLRGKDMADVIFKGTTGAGGRKPSNTAEASLIVENSDRLLRYDSDEIKITRRVYRSGEGEYLINGEPCRLRDIRDLVRGTGLGADSYSLIEQGKVDQLLRASPKDRRAIFEEAAGISRFKAKKIEAERRLARVEQNLVRLADIVEEVGSRYRKIASQASKAAKYKQYTERLQSLRTYVGAKDWRDFSQRLNELTAEKADLIQQAEQQQGELNSIEQRSQELDALLDRCAKEILAYQQRLNEVIPSISEAQSQIALHQSRTEDLQSQIAEARQQLQHWQQRSDQYRQQNDDAIVALASATHACEQAQSQLVQVETGIAEADQLLSHQREALEELRSRQSQASQHRSAIESELSGAVSQRKMALTDHRRLETSLASLVESIDRLKNQLHEHLQRQQELQNEAAAKDSALQARRNELRRSREELEEAKKQLAEQRRSHAGATQRAEVIQELENRLEGVGGGVKDLLQKSQQEPEGAYGDIIGLVADLIKVSVQHADLVDLALGDYAQSLVINGSRFQELLVGNQLKLSGRARFISLNNPPQLGVANKVDLHDQAGVVGRLDQLVQTPPRFVELVSRLLGGTWLVKTMADAVRLRAECSKLVRYITLHGDLLESDGSIIAGPRSAVSGIVSRRSELRALHGEIEQLSSEIEISSRQIDALTEQTSLLDDQVQQLLGEHTEIASQLSDQRAKHDSASQQLADLLTRQQQTETDLSQASKLVAELDAAIGDRERQLSDLQQLSDEISRATLDRERDLSETETQRQSLQRQQTTHKVDLAKSEQQQRDAESRCTQLAQQLDETQGSIAATRSGVAKNLWQRRASRRQIADTSEHLQHLQADKGELDQQLEVLNQQREKTDSQRREVASTASTGRDSLRKLKDAIHELELRDKQLFLERQQLAERLRDDYDIDVSQLDNATEEMDEDRAAIDREITELRKSIGNIGSVNMDALAELEETQQRYETLDAQYQDLVSSKGTLEKIIQRINQDSRKLFAETLDSIRTNFQKLFRQSFGGGRADLVLEEEVDILEAGVEIMATPPGKPEFNNSLLSGGERALTAVSLLMSIFQFRPSPVCVLDEVDAPFDEANISRFIDVLKSFLGWTKFVIVTHSKMTMTSATTLYGITMQESGVSKKVSVRFEDVSEDGTISPDAVAADRDDDSAAVA